MKFIYENASLLELAFVLIALTLFLIRLWKSSLVKQHLERDRSGLWKYHKDTLFRRVEAIGEMLENEEQKDKSSNSSSILKCLKAFCPFCKKDKKAESKELSADKKKLVAVINFKGDVRAKEHNSLSCLIDEIEVNKAKIEEVVVCVNSPGGFVSQYGHVYSEMERIRNLEIPLTVCIDVVAASGGYLMSLPANKIIAAPFSMVGSIGVAAFVPNVRKMLLNWDINPRTFTAGKFKRTVSLTDNATEEEIALFQAQLESVHRLFSQAVSKYRKGVNIEAITTGEHWTAAEAYEKGLGLVDDLGTSSQYLLKKSREHDLVFISSKKSWFEEGVSIFASLLGREVESRVRGMLSGSMW